MRRKLVEYLKKNLKKGYTSDTLKFALINQGYSRTHVEEALRVAQKEIEEASAEKQIPKEKPKIKYEIYDYDNKPILYKKKSFWQRLFNFD